jgi:hypothetical protein
MNTPGERVMHYGTFFIFYFLPAPPAPAPSPNIACSRFMDVRVQAEPRPMPAPNAAKILRPAVPVRPPPPRNSTTPAKPPMTRPAQVCNAMLSIPFRIVKETTRSEVIMASCCFDAEEDDDDDDADSIFFQFDFDCRFLLIDECVG